MPLKLLILYYLLRYKWHPTWRSRAELEKWQEKKIGRFIRQIRKQSPWLARQLALHGDWRAIPPIDKRAFMAQFNDINTAGLDREEAMELALRAERERDFSPTLRGITVGLSTGTSGNRGLFLASKRERAQWVAAVFLKVLKPWTWGRKVKVAFFLRANSNLYNAVQSRLVEFRFFDLLRQESELVQGLQAFQPDVVVAQPSLLDMLARAATRSELHITPGNIISVAEVLDPETEERVSRVFGLRIDQVYQCTEGFLGCTCKAGTLHLNEEFVHIGQDWLDEGKTRFQPIITDFTRTTQPVIRYLLNDVLVLRPTPCPCGSPMLAIDRIEGRSDDMFELADRQGNLRRVYPDFLRRAVAEAGDSITEYRIIQDGPSHLKILLDLEAGATIEATGAALRQSFRLMEDSLGLASLHLDISTGIPALNGQKRRTLQRTYFPQPPTP